MAETRTIAGPDIKRGSSCGALIVWFKTAAGRPMPIDAMSVDPADLNLDLTKHVTHFRTCPNADKHRHRRDTVKKSSDEGGEHET
jgi:hypothetical protein